MNDNQEISYTKPDDIDAKHGKSCDSDTAALQICF